MIQTLAILILTVVGAAALDWLVAMIWDNYLSPKYKFFMLNNSKMLDLTEMIFYFCIGVIVLLALILSIVIII